MSRDGDALVVLLLLIAWSRSSSAQPSSSSPLPAPTPEPAPEPAPPVDSGKPPQRATRKPWSEETMRHFNIAMSGTAGVDSRVVLLGIAAASNFDPGFYLGNNVGLLAVRREHLKDVGYQGPELYSLDPEAQFPWIARVIAYRIASTGADEPKDVADLAVLLNPTTPTVTTILRNEAKRRAAEVSRTRYYQVHAELLRRVIGS